MDDYVAKPIRRDLVADALLRWLSDRARFNASPAAPVEHAAAAPAVVPVESAALEQLRALFHGDLPVIIDTYFADTVQQLGAIEAAIWRKDYAVLTRNAHSLKSSSLSVGARALGELAAKLEDLGRAAGSLAEATQLHTALCTLLRQTEPALRAAV
jgi:HPt (histidine-containing phosphotransfer) domain-containing protein